MAHLLYVCLDGLGDDPLPELDGRTPLEAADTPTLDGLAARGRSGTVVTVGPGIAPESDIAVFAIMSGDVNPMHVDAEFAKSDMFHQVIAHGMWGGALISTLLGTQLPGPGTIYLDQSLRFKKPVLLGDTITVSVKVTEKNEAKKRLLLDCRATNQAGDEVITGIAEVIAPMQKISRPRVIMPEIDLHRTAHRYERLIAMTKGLPPLRAAVVHPVDSASLLGAVEGVVIGIGLGYAVVAALKNQGLERFSIPLARMASIFVIAIVLGIVAAIIPAAVRRSASWKYWPGTTSRG